MPVMGPDEEQTGRKTVSEKAWLVLLNERLTWQC